LQGPSAVYYRTYNFENEPWWPKFDRLRAKYGIQVVKGDHVTNRSWPGQPKTTTSSRANADSSPYQNVLDTKSINPLKPPVKQRKPKPPEPNYPKCRALYSYSATETDELSFNEGDIIYLLKQEGMHFVAFFFLLPLIPVSSIISLNFRSKWMVDRPVQWQHGPISVELYFKVDLDFRFHFFLI
jgi:hypothetical protein